MILSGLLVVAIVAAYALPRLTQQLLPSYAAPDSFERHFPQELSAPVDVAEGRRTADEVAGLFDKQALADCQWSRVAVRDGSLTVLTRATQTPTMQRTSLI